MKKTLLYGAIGGVALYIYLQLQKKKQTVSAETKPSSTNKTTMPTKGVVVKEEPKTPPAPQVEPEVVIMPKPKVSIIKPLPSIDIKVPPLKPIYTNKTTVKSPTPNIAKKPIDDTPRMVVLPKPPVIIKPIDRGMSEPMDKFDKGVSEDTLGRPIDSSGRPIGMPIPKQDVILNGANINRGEYNDNPSFNPYSPHKAYMDRFIATPTRQIISAR